MVWPFVSVMFVVINMLNKIDNYPEFLSSCWQEHLKEKPENAPKVISTFAGCGGSSLGYSMAGFKELLAVEWDDNAVETFKLNFPDVPVYHGDIGLLKVDQCLQLTGLKPGELDVFDGSPPCQGFSSAGQRVMDDPRNSLFREYVRLLRGLQPKIFIMENVSGMVKGVMRFVFIDILKELKASGYKVSAKLLNAQYFGVPQMRERMIFVGVREDLGIDPSHPVAWSKPINGKDAIGDIPTNDLTPTEDPFTLDLWNKCLPGRSFSTVHPKGHWFNTKKASPNRPFNTIIKTVYEKSTATGVYHWELPAKINIPMVKRAGSFPDEYQFIGDYTQQWARIGNSVPPLFMRSIALHLKSILEQYEMV